MKEKIAEMLKNGLYKEALEKLSVGNQQAAMVLADLENETAWLCSSGQERVLQDYTDELMMRILQMADQGGADLFLDEVKADAGRGGEGAARMFLSYNHSDYETAKAITTYLRDRRYDPFLDTVSMRPGDDIRNRVTQEIMERDYFLVLLSQHSLKSQWVCIESSIASVKALTNNNRVIPIRLDNSLENPSMLRDIRQSIDKQIEEMKSEVQESLEKNKWDRRLADDMTRLQDFRRQHGDMVDQYKALANIDISGDRFGEGMQRLVDELQRYQAR